MGSDLQLTGLASGFDWSSVVDQLIELERIPQKRLESQKVKNEEKISDLDLLKSQLDSLNTASTALQNEDLFQARKVSYGDTTSSFSANAAAGAITGDFEIKVESLATKTEMSSINRTSRKLGGGLDPSMALSDLPLHTSITEGTFTIAGRTFSITNLDITLQDLLDEINAQTTSVPGVNPEGDASAITFSYDSVTDKLVVDSGESTPGATRNLPVLGSSTDSSNFLKAMRLLSRTTSTVDADIENGSGVSLFSPGDGSKSWLHSADNHSGVHPGDSRSYAEFNGKLYERVHKESQYNSSSDYVTGDKVYNQGFLYEALSDQPSGIWDGSQTSLGDKVRHEGKSFELLVNLQSVKIDNFSSVDAGNHSVTQATNPAGTASTNAYRAGDIVEAGDGSFFRAIQDRSIASSVDWAGYTDPNGYSSAISSQGWAQGIPDIVHEQGRVFQLSSAASALVHGGPGDTMLYTSENGWGDELKLVHGSGGIAGAEGNYYQPNVAAWNNISSFADTNTYETGDIVLHLGQFLQAKSDLDAAAFDSDDWEDVTNDVNDLSSVGGGGLVDSFWDKADVSLSNSNFWSEVAHANSKDDFDANYWQEISPEMSRYDSTGTGGPLDSIDYSIWAHIGSVGSYLGDDIAGNRDGAELRVPDDTNFTYNTWAGSASAGELFLQDGKVFEARVDTTAAPNMSGSENDWNLVADSNTMSAVSVSEQANKSKFTDSDYWASYDVPDPDADSGHWQIVREEVLSSSQALGNLNMSVSLAAANFNGLFDGLSSGLGNFFVGDGEGAVRIDYDVNRDSLSDLIERVNGSSANVDMYYDPVSDRFVVKSKNSGSTGIVMHESATWDTLGSANLGAGNILSLMGLAAPSEITDEYDSMQSYSKGDFVSLTSDLETTYWQATTEFPAEPPSAASVQWSQVIRGVARSLESELGSNSIVRVNGGARIYSTETEFLDSEHGYKGISFDVARVSIGANVGFTVSKDSSAAKNAIDKFVEEFNDAQDYIKSLVSVTNDGEKVTAGRFSSNLEISRLSSQLRKVVFGDSTVHSESGTTRDGSNLIINSNDASNTELNQISSQLSLDTNDTGYIVKVLDDHSSGDIKFYRWGGSDWAETSPTYSSFRISDLGLDFGIGSDNIQVKNSAKLLEALQAEPEKVQALFAEVPVEDAFDLNTKTERKYQGLSYALEDYISSFLTGDDSTGYKGAYTTHIETIKSQNQRLDQRIEDQDKYLEQREETLRAGFMRMEEMQSKINTQMQTLQSSFNNNNKK